METKSTLLLDRGDVRELLGLTECIDAVEMVFRRQAEGKIPPSGILGVRTQSGGLHVKTARLTRAKNYIAVKMNTNFPQNYARFGLHTIQGVIVLFDADNGRALAVLDSMEITIKRTAAATAVVAAVRLIVISIESRTASARPLSASNSTIMPWIVGRPKRA